MRSKFESGHLRLLSGAGEGEVVSKEVGEEERREEEWTGGAKGTNKTKQHTHMGLSRNGAS